MNSHEVKPEYSTNDKGAIKNSLSNKNNIQQKIMTDISPLIEISDLKPIAYIVELGSNHQASHNLQQARMALMQYSDQAHWSTEYINPDYTATESNPKPDYTNQCGYLTVNQDEQTPQSLGDLVKASKVIEKKIECDFYEADKINQLDVDYLLPSISKSRERQVIIDIDILAIKTESGRVIALAERYPFKQHEWVGLAEVYQIF